MTTITKKAAPPRSAAIYLFPTMKLVVAVLCAFLTGNVHALYQCKDKQGKTSFQDQPCATEQHTISATSTADPAPHRHQIGSEEHIKSVAEDLNRQVSEKAKENPPRPRLKTAPATTTPLTNTEAQSMPYERCIATVNRTVLQLGLSWQRAPIVLNSSDLYIRRMCTDTGSVLITCSRPDQKMITSTSPYDPATGCT